MPRSPEHGPEHRHEHSESPRHKPTHEANPERIAHSTKDRLKDVLALPGMKKKTEKYEAKNSIENTEAKIENVESKEQEETLRFSATPHPSPTPTPPAPTPPVQTPQPPSFFRRYIEPTLNVAGISAISAAIAHLASIRLSLPIPHLIDFPIVRTIAEHLINPAWHAIGDALTTLGSALHEQVFAGLVPAAAMPSIVGLGSLAIILPILGVIRQGFLRGLTGRPIEGGYFNNIIQGGKLILDPIVQPLRAVGRLLGGTASEVRKIARGAVLTVRDGTRFIARLPRLAITAPLFLLRKTWDVVKSPRTIGTVAGGIAGVALLAPFTGGASIIWGPIGAALGYYLGSRSSRNSAAPASSGGAHDAHHETGHGHDSHGGHH